MSAKFRGVGSESAFPGGIPGNGVPNGDPNKTRNFNESPSGTDGMEGLNNDAHAAAAEHPPGLKLTFGLIQLIWGAVTNCIQVATSTLAWLSMILEQPTLTSHIPPFLFSRWGWEVLIALAMGIGPQVLLHMHAQSMSSTWHRIRHIQSFNIKSLNSLKDVKFVLNARAALGWAALIIDVISDATFGSIFTKNPIVIGAWMIFLTGCSTLCMYDGATKVWGAVEDAKDYTAYHAKFDPKEK